MFKLYLCIATQHDWRLVLVSAVVCLAATLTTFFLYSKTPAFPAWRRFAFLGLTGLVAGCGIWTTHFVAMLAFKTGLPTGYSPFETLLSLVVAVTGASAGFGLSSAGAYMSFRRRTAMAVIGGLVIGLSMTRMHYVGMDGYHTQGHLLWDRAYVAGSIVVGAVFSTAALLTARPGSGWVRRAAAAGLFTLGIVGMHFTGMSAVTIVPDAAVSVRPLLMQDTMMAASAVIVTTLIMLAAVGGSLFDMGRLNGQSKRFRNALDAMPDGLAVYDAQDRLISWNTRYAKSWNGCELVVGCTFSELLKFAIDAGFYGDLSGREAEVFAEHLEQRRLATGSHERHSADGAWWRIYDRRTADGGTISGITEITDLKRAEAAMAMARDEAQAASRVKSEFLANMSHEVRTPMNGIMGMNALMLRTDLTSDQRKFSEAIRISAEALLGIINDILDISKLEAGKVEIEQIDFSLETVVEDVVELMSARAQEKLLEVACYLDQGARRPLRGDPTRIRQVLMNLMSNAVKFTDEGVVSIEVRCLRSEAEHTGLRIEVQDTGIGLTPAAKTNLFQKFHQADGSITRRFGGTGLGLSICRQLVQLMGGTIGVNDREGGGSVFWVEMDLANGAAPKKAASTGTLKGARILVVDDIELNRSIFRRQLEAEGVMISEADGGLSGMEAIRQAQAEGAPFDLVLMDHMMPDVSGDVIGQQVREQAAWFQPKLVLASSIGVLNKTDRAAKPAFDAFLAKPVRLKALIDCLVELLSRDAHPHVGTAVQAPAAPALRRGRILIAEDNDINIMLAQTLLEQEGYTVECAVNGLEAIEAAHRCQFDLILMDVQMPVMDGLEATRRLRASGGEHGQVPIVAMTANAMAHDQQACFDAGMVDFVSKPFDPDMFLRVVARYAGVEGVGRTEIAASAAAELAAFDEVHFGELTHNFKPNQIVRLLDSYLGRSEERLQSLCANIEAGNFEAGVMDAHGLRGVAANFGAQRLAALARSLERACEAKDLPGSLALLPSLMHASRAADAILSEHRDASDRQMKAAS